MHPRLGNAEGAAGVEVVDVWTGRHARALQRALRMTNERFAETLGTAVRTVATWHANPDREPTMEMQAALDTLLERASEHAQARFAKFTDSPDNHDVPDADDLAVAERRLLDDPNMRAACDWLDAAARRSPGSARQDVARELTRLDPARLHDRVIGRARVERSDVAAAVARYYGSDAEHSLYRVTVDDGPPIRTSILTAEKWLQLAAPLDPAGDRMQLGADPIEPTPSAQLLRAAVRRLAEIALLGSRLVDAPLYRLTQASFEPGRIAGSFGMTTFIHYALTIDLLESELVDAIAGQQSAQPLRDALLPDVRSVLDVERRLCCGGALALCAIARPPRPGEEHGDYVFLVQERSGKVLNASSRLAVIPKAFHGPLVDFEEDARIGATVRREMEEELFGREDVDTALGSPRAADPMHRSRLSEPMRWLVDAAGGDAWDSECTAVGFNLVSGNYEFACLIAIHDPEFWRQFGGQIAANWESAGLRQYSSRNRAGLRTLASDRAWSNEGVFALLQGMHRLQQIGDPARLDLPTIEWSLTADDEEVGDRQRG
jgi:hypothetical protein